MNLYPLKFIPRLVEKMWGGRKLETVLGKTLPPNKPIGESWELYDFPPGVVDSSAERLSSIIANGPLAGRSLHWAVKEFGADLLAKVPLVGPHGQFPLLIKFLDAREDLSVQVHPDEEFAARNPTAHLKTEAWYVMQHDPGARIFKGLRPATTPETFRKAIDAGSVEAHLGTIDAEVGQCHYLPSGTIHALGAGMLVAEVQTPSDTTFRVYDFNRVDPSTGKTRTLHVEQAMQCIDFTEPTAAPGEHSAWLASSPYFRIARRHVAGGVEMSLARPDPVIWIMLKGQAMVKADGSVSATLSIGETVLLPPALKDSTLNPTTDLEWLEVTFPLP